MSMGQQRKNEASYEEDFYSWAHEQAARLRAGDWQAVDVANVAEEIETLGRSEAAALRSSLASSPRISSNSAISLGARAAAGA